MKLTKLIMSIYPLKLFNTGQVTLPKEWRDQFNTKNFLAEDTGEGLLIKPLQNTGKGEKAVYYKTEKEFGLFFPKGIDPQVLIDKINEIHGRD